MIQSRCEEAQKAENDRIGKASVLDIGFRATVSRRETRRRFELIQKVKRVLY